MKEYPVSAGGAVRSDGGRDRVRVAAAVSGADAGGAGDDESGQGEECGEGCGGRADQK